MLKQIETNMNIVERIAALRAAMNQNGIGAVIIPSNDPHQSEYVAELWKGREWISGFTGSAGTIVIGKDKAGLWTDSRYYLQGSQELSGTGIDLYKLSDIGYADWLGEELGAGGKVAIAGDICAIGQLESLEGKLSKYGVEVVTQYDLISEAWEGQPELPGTEIFTLDVKYCGESRVDKLSRIKKKMAAQGAEYHLVSTLDDIAWIFNIRGSDVDFNPVAVAYALIGQEKTILYIQDHKVPASIKSELAANGVECKDYFDIVADLNHLPEGKTILIDPSNCSSVHYKAINCNVVRGKTIARHMKAIKNDVEIAHSKNSMVKDGVALANTFYWLEQLHKSGSTCTEAEFSDKLAESRGKQDLYVGESFPAIIGYRSNGAIIHYRPMHGSSHEIKPEGILLADSGGQYLDGTTDITRTITLSTPSQEEKRNFTLVLKGHIQLARAKFPKGTTGGQLDTLARMHLWEHGLNYGHGTGHGVGFFLNVHEPPQGFAPGSSERANVAHEAGMFSSNEPGFYKEGAYGMRIENLFYTVKSKMEGFLEFDTITLYPIDLKLIDENIMTKSEKAWLNKYHNEVLKKVGPHLEGDMKTWFEIKCRGMN